MLVGLVTSSPAAGTIVILSGALTTVTHSALPAAGFSSVTEKHYFILDHLSGKYSQYRVYLDNARKKKVEEINFGTCSGHVTTGDKNAKSTVYQYLDTRGSASMVLPQDPTTVEWLQLFGVVTAGLRDAVNATNLVPASMTFSYRHFYRSPMNAPDPTEYHLERTGRLSLERKLSKAANDAGDDLNAAVARVRAVYGQ